MTQTAQYPDLQGASVFITGGGSGIGASLTEGFLRQGAKVAFVQRSDSTAFCDQMEAETGIPIYDSTSAVVWHTLKLVGVDPARCGAHWGSLFEASPA